MPFYTPLRYPGGKRRLAQSVMQLLNVNSLKKVHYVEPYAGGTAIGLALLFQGYASTISINDLSRPVYAFWHSVLNGTEDLCHRIKRTKVTMREWSRQRDIYDQQDSVDLTKLGFAALFLNRTNRSGIIGGGVIGGKQQSGTWRLDARFNKPELIDRIRKISMYKTRIHLYQLDGIDFTDQVIRSMGQNTFVFYDPPYIENGDQLYLSNYDSFDHRMLAARIRKLKQPWLVTYDYAAVKYDLYPLHRRISYKLHYCAHNRYHAKEVMFVSNALKLPSGWTASTRFLMTAADSRYPLYGRMEGCFRAKISRKGSSSQRSRN